MFDQPVRSVMERRKLLKAAPETLVSKAAKLMAAKNVGAVLVVEANCLVGIVSERDIVYGIARRGRSFLEMRVRDVMHSDPPVCQPDDSLRDVMAKMTRLRVRHLSTERAPKTERQEAQGTSGAR